MPCRASARRCCWRPWTTCATTCWPRPSRWPPGSRQASCCSRWPSSSRRWPCCRSKRLSPAACSRLWLPSGWPPSSGAGWGAIPATAWGRPSSSARLPSISACWQTGRIEPAEIAVEKPNAPSCERNREPILEVLKEHFADRREVLEIGSGTGQHAIFFAAALPHLNWQTSDRRENLPGIAAWLDDAALPNTPPPLEFDVVETAPGRRFDAIFSANTLHIMPWAAVDCFFAGLPGLLAEGAKVVIYGPFNYGGR